MPLIANSTYQPTWYLFNGHLETIVPSALRKINGAQYQRTRFELPDGDFVDLDWLTTDIKRKKLAIISHGLEGSSKRHYSHGMAKYFFERDWDALSWNCRSCGGEMNRLPRFYHHGDTEDFGLVIEDAIAKGYEKIILIGFSMGGSFGLKYLGEKGKEIPAQVKGSVSYSVPCDLAAGGRILDGPGNVFYRKRFIGKLRTKLIEKAKHFPQQIDASKLDTIKTFEDFNNCFTSPLHGFRDSDDFYQQSSCLPHLDNISVPSLLVNAENDPLLTPECFPRAVAERSRYFFLEIPKRGGHVGFPLRGREENWMEIRALEFVKEIIGL